MSSASACQRSIWVVKARIAEAHPADPGILGALMPIGHITPKIWGQVMDVNVTANWRLIRSLDPLLRRSDAGQPAEDELGPHLMFSAFFDGDAHAFLVALCEALPDEGLVVDLRSGSYTSMWAPKDGAVTIPDRVQTSHSTTATPWARKARCSPWWPPSPPDGSSSATARSSTSPPSTSRR